MTSLSDGSAAAASEVAGVSRSVAGSASVLPASREPEWFTDLRRKAAERFTGMSWPTPIEEEWRRTDLSRYDLSMYASAREVADARVLPSAASKMENAAGVIRLEGGTCVRHILCADSRERGVRLMSLRDALAEFEVPLRGLFTRALTEADNRFIPWHLSEMDDGAFLYVPPFVEIPEPFLIECVEGGRGVTRSPHTVVFLDRGARAVVVERALSGGEDEVLWNAGLDLIVSDSAALGFYESQELGPKSLVFRNASAVVGRDASFTHFDAELGGRLVKTRVDCGLEGSGSEADLKGIYFCGGGQHMDIRTVQRHKARSVASRAYYKGAVKDDGRSIFQGLIEVSPGASGTDAFLTNRNLILNDGARSDSIPSLKIGNNDVKCSHGSTTGRIDEEHLFYLMSRGLSASEAREMIVTGYFEDLAAGSPEVFRFTVLEAVRARLEQEPSPRPPSHLQ